MSILRKKVNLFSIISVLIVSSFVLMIEACHKENISYQTPTPLKFEIPPGFPNIVYAFRNNPLTEEGFALGKKLFYDLRLSKDSGTSCAGCHQQGASFATYGHDFSHGWDGGHGRRNALSLINLAWQQEFRWDGGASSLKIAPIFHFLSAKEFNKPIPEVLKLLNADAEYNILSQKAFGVKLLNQDLMLRALAQFTASLVSANSVYDKVKRGEATFTTQEEWGYTLFKANCSTCHPEPLFTDFSYRNIGLSLNTKINDFGRMEVTHDPNDSLKFKVPSLRNVDESWPYMHNGRFVNLDQVITHYSTGINQSPTLDPLLVNGLPFTFDEKKALIAFLKTLTDKDFLLNPRFSE